MMAALDHLVVTGPTLAAASAWIEGRLGVPLQPGGEHDRAGTHNALVRLGESSYLEAIAANPSSRRPERARWFGLDELAPDSRPRLATWVARTDDVHAAARAVEPGFEDTIVPMSRGSFEWLITVPSDGSMPLGGAAPTIMQWLTPVHPASQLIDRGCRLVRLAIGHPEPGRIRSVLRALGIRSSVEIVAHDASWPSLRAHIEAPGGVRTLG